MTVGDRLKLQRERAQLSQGQVGQYEGVTPQYISDLERGRNNPPAWSLLARLAKRYKCTTDYLLGLSEYPNGYAPEAPISRSARDAISLIDSLPPEKRPSAVELLRAIIVFAEVGVPLPEPVDARDGGGVATRERTSTTSAPIWEMGADKPSYRQLGLTVMNEPSQADLDRQLARLKRLLPEDVYEYVVYLTNAGRPLSDADIEFLLKASDHHSLLEEFKTFQDSGSIGNG